MRKLLAPLVVGVILSGTFLVFHLSSTPAGAQKVQPTPDNSARELVHLLDYLAQDYSGAVKNGKVISHSEYQEQVEFSETAAALGHRISILQNTPEVVSNIDKLHALIQEKSAAGEVTTLSQLLKNQVIQITGLTVSPDHWPSLAHGQQLYSQTCVTCHGSQGDGKGVAAKSLKPVPANFLDDGTMKHLSPFKAFNAIRIGVQGTAMVAQPLLSDKDIWDLAFYVVSLRHQGEMPNQRQEIEAAFKNVSRDFNLEKAATSSDEDLRQKLNQTAVAALRTHSGDDDSHNSLQTARAELQNALDEYKDGHFEGAKAKALVAYLEGIEPVEPRLSASDPNLTSDLESRMAFVRSTIEGRQPLESVKTSVEAANHDIDLAALLLNQSAPSAWITFFIAAAILLREGFEAVLIIIALLGVIRASGAKQAYKWVHGGWIAALAMGAVAWFLSGWLMAISGAQRELMEGVTSVFAVIVLLYMGFWLHRTTEIGRWTKFINGKVKTALEGKRLFGLAAISFMAVFREAFECVLFLRALWLEGGMETRWAMSAGVFGAFALIMFLAWIILKYAAKIPIRKLFDFSASLMTLLAVILVGKGIHSLQETGLFGVTASPINLRIDLVGFFPTLETTLAQAAILGIALSLWFFGKKPSVVRKPVIQLQHQ